MSLRQQFYERDCGFSAAQLPKLANWPKGKEEDVGWKNTVHFIALKNCSSGGL